MARLRGYRYTIARMRWRLGAGQGDTMADLTGKRALVIVEGYGTEEPELLQPVEFLRERGAEVDIAAAQNPIDCVTGDRYDSQQVVPDKMLAETGAEGYDVLIVPGGTVNMDRLRINPEAHRIMREFMEAKKVVACICHGPWLLVNAGVAEGKTVTSCEFNRIDMENGGFVWVDEEAHVDDSDGQTLITSRCPDDLPAFCAAIEAALA